MSGLAFPFLRVTQAVRRREGLGRRHARERHLGARKLYLLARRQQRHQRQASVRADGHRLYRAEAGVPGRGDSMNDSDLQHLRQAIAFAWRSREPGDDQQRVPRRIDSTPSRVSVD